MRIKRLETHRLGHIALVKAVTDDGAAGWGQIAPYHAELAEAVFHTQVAPHALGADPADPAALAERIVEAEYKFPGSHVCRALAGLDTALWDLLARRAGKSVCEFVGGSHRPFLTYGSSMRRDIQPDEEAARLKRLSALVGYRAFKVRIGKVCGHDADEWPGRTEALIPACRKQLGNEISLLVDGNSCYTPKKAIAVGRFLESHGVCHFEEPCPYWELEWTAEVAAALSVDIAGGEQDTDLAQFRRMIRTKAVDLVQPDVCYVGGFSRARQVALDAHAAGIPCVPHSANRSFVTVFTLHLMGAIPNPGKYVEYSIEPDAWADEIFEPALAVKAGRVSAPPGPGWGVTVRPDWLARAATRSSGTA